MSKIYKFVDPLQAETSTQSAATDWSRCILCQEESSEVLHCPADCKREAQGYKNMADLLLGFSMVGELPKRIDLSRLDEGDGTEKTLLLHKASWHDSCRLKYNKTKLLRAEKRKRCRDESADVWNKKFTRQGTSKCTYREHACFFCGTPATPGESLREASTFGLDFRVRQCALKLEDKALLAKLSAGDLIAQEAKYHLQCLVSLYNKARDSEARIGSDVDAMNHGIAFAELVSFMEDVRSDDAVAPVFKLTQLTNLYSNRLEQLGTDVGGRIHSTKLKERILAYFPDMQAHKQGRNVILIFNEDIGSALRKACEHDADNDAVILVKAANIVRRDMFEMQNHYSGSFGISCQEKSVPNSLLALVAMVVNGPNIKAQSSSSQMPQPILTIAQLLMHNSLMRCRQTQSTSAVRHSQERETPLPMYVGIMIHTKTRKRELVDNLYQLGLSISYDRVLGISTELGNKICHQYQKEKAVCPQQLKCGLFTTAAVDNIDHNPSSTTSLKSFHGTGISLFQHPDNKFSGAKRCFMHENRGPNETKISYLPESYTTVPPVGLISRFPSLPKQEGPTKVDCQLISLALAKEYDWLKRVCQVLESDTVEMDEMISWAAYHASHQTEPITEEEVAITSLLPLFLEDSMSLAMIKHSMDIVKTAVEVLNPDQVPIITCDQPLYTIAKKIQWNWPTSHGEKHFLIMFGGLHIEMAIMKTLGHFLDGSGWTAALVHAGVATIGTAESFVKASHVTRTRRVHQVTAASLYVLQKKAYTDYCRKLKDESKAISMEDWCTQMAEAYPHVRFWSITLHLELVLLMYVRAIREGDFPLYIESLSHIVPWFFALDRTNYARWIPVHLRDMVGLKQSHPDIYAEFMNGKFVVKKTRHAFSAIAIDQAHEQNNACVKGDGGAIGLTENPAALRRWMISGPEMARLLGEFESSMEKRRDTDLRHHEEKKHTQVAFALDVRSLSGTIEEMGNPFLEESNDLLVLDNRNIMSAAVASTVQEIEKLGLDQYETYVNDRLINRTTSIEDPIKRNNFQLFKSHQTKFKSGKHEQMALLKNDCSLFSRLYVASQIRNGDLDKFFMHENQAYPPSLSHMGTMRTGNKSDLLGCLEKLVVVTDHVTSPTVEVILIDGAAIINMLRPGTTKTFQEYATDVFVPYITSQLLHVKRLDIIWDVYLSDSLKANTRSKRGTGVRKRVEPANKIPGNWQEFLRVNENKTELFTFLSTMASRIVTNKQIITTHNTNVLCTGCPDISGLEPCTHEEADTRILLHLEHAVRAGHSKILIRTVDTDVVVLAITSAQRLNILELWIGFGAGKNFRFLAAHEMSRALGPDRCVALPMFHAFTGCDTVSCFGGRGKNTAWDTWNAFGDVTQAFCVLAAKPTPECFMVWLGLLERFVVLLYDRTSCQQHVNDARKQLFTQKGRGIEGLPPTQDALMQHIKRAAYQAGHCWAQVMNPIPELPSPSDWGWEKKNGGGWQICWTTLPEAAEVCRELIRCGCKKACTGQCKCLKAGLQCTALCLCGGLCNDQHSLL